MDQHGKESPKNPEHTDKRLEQLREVRHIVLPLQNLSANGV